MLNGWKTLGDVLVGEIGDALAEPFKDPSAYKEIRGGVAGAAGLTDIVTAWMLERLNEVFGPYGLGWWLDWNVDDVLLGFNERRASAALKKAEFCYLIINKDGEERICRAPCTGGSINELPYALKGMETSAIGNAASKMRFQEAVYKGKLNHRNAQSYLGTPETGEVIQKEKGNISPKGDPKTDGNSQRSGSQGSTSSVADYVVPMGKYRGRKFSELDKRVILWYVKYLKSKDDHAEELRVAAKAYLRELEAAEKQQAA
jgi:hypothetical protein